MGAGEAVANRATAYTAEDTPHDSARGASGNDYVPSYLDGLGGRTNIQCDGKNGAITGLKGELPCGLLEARRSDLDFAGAGRKGRQIELAGGVCYGRESLSIGNLTHCMVAPGMTAPD